MVKLQRYVAHCVSTITTKELKVNARIIRGESMIVEVRPHYLPSSSTAFGPALGKVYQIIQQSDDKHRVFQGLK